MNILFVTYSYGLRRPYQDGSGRYRCFNPAWQMLSHGAQTLVCTQAQFEADPALMSGFDVYLFHRPFFNATFAEKVMTLKRRHTVIADFDDLIFDMGALPEYPYIRNNPFAFDHMSKDFACFCSASSMFSLFTVSTEPLRKAVERLFAPEKAITLHNAAIAPFEGLCRAARLRYPYRDRPYLFGYFPGTPTHDDDFRPLFGMLIEKLGRSGERMLLLGQLGLPLNNLKESESPIDRKPAVPFDYLPELMAQCRIILAPLSDNIFNSCKSGIKFFESALCGSYVFASPLADMERFSSPLLTICPTLEDWENALDTADALSAPKESDIEAVRRQATEELQIEKFIANFCA